jgi:hypothetical protein
MVASSARDDLVVIPQAYSGRRFGWLGPVFLPQFGGFSRLIWCLAVYEILVATSCYYRWK